MAEKTEALQTPEALQAPEAQIEAPSINGASIGKINGATKAQINMIFLAMIVAAMATGKPAEAAECNDIVFSDSNNQEYGCMVAAALDLSMPGTLAGVEKKIDGWNAKQLERYNARLERLVRKYVWLVLDYQMPNKGAVLNPKADNYMKAEDIAELLRESATLLDVVAVGRNPRGPKGPKGPKGDKGDPSTCPTCPDPDSGDIQ